MNFVKSKGSGVWQVRYRTQHGVKSVSTRETVLTEAKRFAEAAKIRELEEAARIGAVSRNMVSKILTGKVITVETAMKDWGVWMGTVGMSPRTIHSNQQYVRQWAKSQSLDNQPLSSVTDHDIHAWINRKDDGLKATTRKGQLSAIRNLFHFAAAKGWVLSDPSSIVRVVMSGLSHEQKERRVVEPFTDEEVARLLAITEAGTFWHTAVAIGRYTGLRLGDICGLEWSSLSRPGLIIVWTDKRDRRVELPLAPGVLADAIGGVAYDHPKYLFPEQAGIIKDLKRRALLSVQFRRLCEQIGVTTKTFHSLRHSYITDMDRKGVPIEHISRAVGHANTAMTRHYIAKP